MIAPAYRSLIYLMQYSGGVEFSSLCRRRNHLTRVSDVRAPETDLSSLPIQSAPLIAEAGAKLRLRSAPVGRMKREVFPLYPRPQGFRDERSLRVSTLRGATAATM